MNKIVIDKNNIVICTILERNNLFYPDYYIERYKHSIAIIHSLPENFDFIIGKWIYNSENQSIIQNPEYETKINQGLIYDWEHSEWIIDSAKE